ncbi:MAG: tetratricopeptide repeat protein [Candidatus Eremiobacterota bacterium]
MNLMSAFFDTAGFVNEKDMDYFITSTEMFDKGNYEGALKSIDKAINLDIKFARAWNFRGLILDRLNRYEEAIRNFDIAIQIDDEEPEYRNNRRLSLYNLGNHREAEKEWNNFLNISMKEKYFSILFTVLSIYGHIFLKEREFSKIEKAGYIFQLREKGRNAYFHGKYIQAIYFYDKILKASPSDGDSWNNRGLCQLNMNFYEKALKCYNKAVEINRGNDIYLTNRGLVLNFMKRYEDALENFNKAIEINPGNEQAWYWKGDTLYKLGRNDEALKCCEKTLELNPYHALAWNKRGLTMVSSGMYDEAFNSYKKALDIEPFYQEAIVNRDELLRITGKFLNDFKEEKFPGEITEPEENKNEFTSVFAVAGQAEAKETAEPSFSFGINEEGQVESKKIEESFTFSFNEEDMGDTIKDPFFPGFGEKKQVERKEEKEEEFTFGFNGDENQQEKDFNF